MLLNFIKMNALGNDFVMVDGREYSVDKVVSKAEYLCDRHFGIGADGVIFILPGRDGTDFTMRIINSDGSEAEMCGNGIRCFALWLDQHGEFSGDELSVFTLAGIIRISRDEELYRVNMGAPVLTPSNIPLSVSGETVVQIPISVNDEVFHFTAVSMGNPHAVFFTDEITDRQILSCGPQIEQNQIFPNKTNVEFVKVISRSELEMRVWERGCGETFACGTGACAVMVAAVLNQYADTTVTIHLRGGDLKIEWDSKSSSPVYMTGGADYVFSGTLEL